MLVLRLLSIGLCATGVVLIANLEPPRVEVVAHAVTDPTPSVSTVDVAHQVEPAVLAELIHLRSQEWISAINDRPMTGEFMVSEVIGSLARRAGEYIDLTISSRTTERRVLVLMH